MWSLHQCVWTTENKVIKMLWKCANSQGWCPNNFLRMNVELQIEACAPQTNERWKNVMIWCSLSTVGTLCSLTSSGWLQWWSPDEHAQCLLHSLVSSSSSCPGWLCNILCWHNPEMHLETGMSQSGMSEIKNHGENRNKCWRSSWSWHWCSVCVGKPFVRRRSNWRRVKVLRNLLKNTALTQIHLCTFKFFSMHSFSMNSCWWVNMAQVFCHKTLMCAMMAKPRHCIFRYSAEEDFTVFATMWKQLFFFHHHDVDKIAYVLWVQQYWQNNSLLNHVFLPPFPQENKFKIFWVDVHPYQHKLHRNFHPSTAQCKRSLVEHSSAETAEAAGRECGSYNFCCCWRSESVADAYATPVWRMNLGPYSKRTKDVKEWLIHANQVILI